MKLKNEATKKKISIKRDDKNEPNRILELKNTITEMTNLPLYQ